MRSPSLPIPLVSGAPLLYFISGFYSCLTLFYFMVGTYGFELAEVKEAVVGNPVASALAVVAAAAVSGGFTAARRRLPTWVAALLFLVVVVLFFATFATFQRLILSGSADHRIIINTVPVLIFTVWTIHSVQRHTALFTRCWQGLDSLVKRLEQRIGLKWIALLVGVLWTSQLVLAALNRYYRLTLSIDTGRFNQVFYSTLDGNPFYQSLIGGNHLGFHFSPSIGILLPIWAMVPGVRTLLVLESLILGAAAIPLWWLTFRVTESRRVAYIFAMVYLFFPHTQGLNINGFRAMAFWPLVGFAYLLLLETPGFYRKWWFWLMVLFTLGIRENISVTLAAISSVYFMMGRERKAHAVIVLLATGWFLGVTKLLMPWLHDAPGWIFHIRFSDMVPAEHLSFSGYLTNALLNPILAFGELIRARAISFAWEISLPLLFFPWFAGLYLIALIPSLLLTNLLGTAETLLSLQTKTMTYMVPWFWCAMMGWNRIKPWLDRRGAAASAGLLYIMLIVAVFQLAGGYAQKIKTVDDVDTAVRHYLESVPEELSVMASKCFLPILSGRRNAAFLSEEADFSKLDIIIAHDGSFCKFSAESITKIEPAIHASGLFKKEVTPVKSLVVYRRVR